MEHSPARTPTTKRMDQVRTRTNAEQPPNFITLQPQRCNFDRKQHVTYREKERKGAEKRRIRRLTYRSRLTHTRTHTNREVSAALEAIPLGRGSSGNPRSAAPHEKGKLAVRRVKRRLLHLPAGCWEDWGAAASLPAWLSCMLVGTSRVVMPSYAVEPVEQIPPECMALRWQSPHWLRPSGMILVGCARSSPGRANGVPFRL